MMQQQLQQLQQQISQGKLITSRCLMPRKGHDILNDGRPCEPCQLLQFQMHFFCGKLNACVQHFFDSRLQYLQKWILNKIDMYVPFLWQKALKRQHIFLLQSPLGSYMSELFPFKDAGKSVETPQPSQCSRSVIDHGCDR